MNQIPQSIKMTGVISKTWPIKTFSDGVTAIMFNINIEGHKYANGNPKEFTLKATSKMNTFSQLVSACQPGTLMAFNIAYIQSKISEQTNNQGQNFINNDFVVKGFKVLSAPAAVVPVASQQPIHNNQPIQPIQQHSAVDPTLSDIPF